MTDEPLIAKKLAFIETCVREPTNQDLFQLLARNRWTEPAQTASSPR
jgi:hypothetical protein